MTRLGLYIDRWIGEGDRTEGIEGVADGRLPRDTGRGAVCRRPLALTGAELTDDKGWSSDSRRSDEAGEG